MRQRSRKLNRGFNRRKNSVKDELIDRQVLAIHVAMVEKLLKHPELHQQIFDTLENRLALGKLRYGAYMTWFSLMDNIHDEHMFRSGVLENSPRMKKLRRTTPFTGVLTEEERQEAMQRAACGEMDIDNLLFG